MTKIENFMNVITDGTFPSKLKRIDAAKARFYKALVDEEEEQQQQQQSKVYTLIRSGALGDAPIDSVKISTEVGLLEMRSFHALDTRGGLAGWIVFYGQSPDDATESCRLLTVRINELEWMRPDGTKYRDSSGDDWVTLIIMEAMAELLRLKTEYIHATSKSPQ
ncbi:hypothetical protein IB269_16445 [Delftia sp. DLF01]|uniref:hypothetical protein n=1 Tax=Delftia sp. DLF01 TaxID=2769279 RepID=UPI00177B5967|nr:hypothetical protein [Delftia sp. DLF01]MBD9582983.1 hypothetical protein [Delftia sp. DLF01]